MTYSHPQQTRGFTGSLLKAIQLIGDSSTHLENAETALEIAYQALKEAPASASSTQIATLFALKVQLAERSINTFEAYNGVIELGKSLLQIDQLWPSTRAYINSELARCCLGLTITAGTYEARTGYHRSMLRYVTDGLADLEKLTPPALKSNNNREIPKVLDQCIAFSASLQDGASTPSDLHATFWRNLKDAEGIARTTKSAKERLLLQVARKLICRAEHVNSQELRNSWAQQLAALVTLSIRRPFKGSLKIITNGYQHLAAISHVANDKRNLAGAAIGLATALEPYPEYAPTRDNYLSLAYEAQHGTGDNKEAEQILTKCRQINLQGRFNGTARLRLFAARKELDTASEALLSEGGVYADLFRSVTAPTRETNEISFRVAKILIQQDVHKFTKKVRAVYEVCQNQIKFRIALAESIRLLITSLAREDLMAPYMVDLASLRPVLPDSHKSLLATISIRQLIRTGKIEEADKVAKLELGNSPRGEENYLREELHLLSVIINLTIGKFKIAGYHLRKVPDIASPQSETSTRRKLLRQTLEFMCAFRRDDTEIASASFGLLVEDFKQVKTNMIFTVAELRSCDALATAIQERILNNSLFEAFEAARVSDF